MPTVDTIAWREWSTEAFSTAHARAKPVLLLLVTTWSAACRQIQAEVFADGAIASLVSDEVVPVRVDAERRPDIADRYTLEGWPTIALLSPEGELLGGGAALDSDRLGVLVVDVAHALRERRAELRARGAVARESRRQPAGADRIGTIDRDAVVRATATIIEAFDAAHGGFGRGARVPHAAPLRLLMAARHPASDTTFDSLVRTLDRIGWSDLSDPRDGAFHRACASPDWTGADTARLLSVQADLVRVFLEAANVLHEPTYLERARAGLHYVMTVLADCEDGGFFASEAESPRQARSSPAADRLIDRTLFADANARMVRACLFASATLGEPTYAEFGIKTLERIVPRFYAPGAGMAHYDDGVPRARGLLIDQIETSAALIDASGVTGSSVYLELAEELMRSALRKFRARTGGFHDRLTAPAGGGDIGLLSAPLIPYGANCEAARVLARLARHTGDEGLLAKAQEALASQTGVYLDHGVLSADYALALLELENPPTLESDGSSA